MKVLVIGSGPIVIGQAAEFDYAGTQACKSLKEEGHQVVLINSNPATIMTDPGVADALYIEPLNVDFCERVIARERPDALLPTLGGQTGLNLAIQLEDAGIIEKYNVRVLGTPLSAIRKAEDRDEFRALMREIREPVPESWIIQNPDELKALLETAPYPCIVRPAYTLGGTGGGIANTPEELWEIGNNGLKLSLRSQIMIERSLLGWKEVEYEVMRDSKGTCITVCNMENFDPMGVHTGDSIVVAPSQTLSDIEYHMLRTASLKIIQALGIEGGCNVQLAVNPESFDYYIIEVNPRVSRSSALASKATGYPIARVAAKIASGKTLDEIENQVTGTTKACFEPALDYCVVKIPRWPFDKFASGDRTLFTQMKATGEVMAIDRTFEGALLKAVRGLEVKTKDLWLEKFAGPRSVSSSMTVPVMSSSTVPVETEEALYAWNPEAGLDRHKGARLPHVYSEGASYFVTFRLADSVPVATREEWREERRRLDELKSKQHLTPAQAAQHERLLSDKIGEYLDAGHGACFLRDPRVATIVAEAMKHFDGERYRLDAFAVMPNHVHAVVTPTTEYDLPKILHSWKSFTAHEINRLLNRSGDFWQDENYDHLIRNQGGYLRCIRYTLDNPVKANLKDWEWTYVREQLAETFDRDGRTTHDRDGHATQGEAPATGEVPATDEALAKAIKIPTDERLWAIAEGLRRGWSVEEVHKLSRVDKWFLRKIKGILEDPPSQEPVGYKMVDTCAGEFESHTPYYYATTEALSDAALC